MTFTNQYKQTLALQFYRIKGSIVLFTVIQIIMALGIAIGFSYLFYDADSQSMLLLATGAPTMVIIITGLVVVPMNVANAKIEGYGEFLRTLPVNRAAIIMADTFIWLLVTLPGIIISLVVTHLLFAPGFIISWWFIPAYLLCAITCIGVGYGYAYAMKPYVAMSLSQIIAFAALMFSPINFPTSRLPLWLQVIHSILPVDAMAQIMRATLAVGTFDVNVSTIIRVLVWCIGGYIVSVLILNKK